MELLGNSCPSQKSFESNHPGPKRWRSNGAKFFSDESLESGFDVLVHCAGITYQRLFTETSTDEYRKLIDVNLSGTFFCLKHAVTRMKSNNIQGSIVVISSISAHRPLPSQAVYSCTKAAMESLVQSIAVEAAPLHIRANCSVPGAGRTHLIREPRRKTDNVANKPSGNGIPYGRVGEPEDMVGTTLFLASGLSAYMTGASLVVDDGLGLRR